VSDTDPGADTAHTGPDAAALRTPDTWRVGDDVTHRDLGHGWVQGAGHGVVTVRFETRGSGPGPARTFSSDTEDIIPANPIDSLDWPDYVAALAEANSEQAADHVAQR
jgi:DNA polymerase-4